MAKWQTVSSEQVYETPWIRVRRDEVLNHNGTPMTYSVVELQRPSVVIVALNEDGQVYLQKNYRYTLNKTVLELPAGFADEQDVLAAAKRELLEETGLTTNDWTNLGMLYQATGIGKIPHGVVLAENVRPSKAELDKEEEITAGTFIDFKEVERMIADCKIAESAHIAALYMTKLHMLTKEEK